MTLKTNKRDVLFIACASIAWTYTLTSVLHARFWSTLFNFCAKTFDLSVAACLLLPLQSIEVIFSFSVIVFVVYIVLCSKTLRERYPLTLFGHVSALSVAFLALWHGSIVLNGNEETENIHECALLANQMSDMDAISADGKVSDGVYVNTNLGFSFRIPPGWFALTQNSIQRTHYNTHLYEIHDLKTALRACSAAPNNRCLIVLKNCNPLGVADATATFSVKSIVAISNPRTTECAEELVRGQLPLNGGWHSTCGVCPTNISGRVFFCFHASQMFSKGELHRLFLATHATTNTIVFFDLMAMNRQTLSVMTKSVESIQFGKQGVHNGQ